MSTSEVKGLISPVKPWRGPGRDLATSEGLEIVSSTGAALCTPTPQPQFHRESWVPPVGSSLEQALFRGGGAKGVLWHLFFLISTYQPIDPGPLGLTS